MNEQTRDRIRLHWFRKYAVVFAVVLLAAVLQFSHERVQQDDYYHITSSVLIRLFVLTDPYPVIRDRFGASYLHIENLPANRVFYLYCMERPNRFGRVYQDGFSAVFIVR